MESRRPAPGEGEASSRHDPLLEVAARAAAHFSRTLGRPPRRLGNGLINATFLLEARDGTHLVLQRLNPMFPARVQEDILAVTTHLASKGIPTCRLVPTRDGALWADLGSDGVWRALTFLPGRSLDHSEDTAALGSAGALVARFHRALDDLDHEFRSVRPGAHDTPRHLALLREALERRRDHPRRDVVAPLAEAILEEAERLPPLPVTPRRVVHGDLKLNNVRFSDEDPSRALALLDLDTLGRGSLPVELGDAFRSWCNRAGEDAGAADFRLELFAAAVAGYASHAAGWITRDEAACLPDATRTIALELAARFCRDAFEESYFGWNAGRFASASEHNELRARGQLALSRAVAARLEPARAVVARALEQARPR